LLSVFEGRRLLIAYFHMWTTGRGNEVMANSDDLGTTTTAPDGSPNQS
jgi:hypothetical protein